MSGQATFSILRWIVSSAAFLCLMPADTPAADRTTCYLPLPSDASAGGATDGMLADQAYGESASPAWSAYLSVWQSHHADPGDPIIRRFLGLPLQGSIEPSSRRGRTTLRSIGWRAGSYQQVDTPHFVIYTRGDDESSRAVAEDLERCYWAWTQVFFPLWEAQPQVSGLLDGWSSEVPITQHLQRRQARITVSRKMRVVLFRDAREYQRTLRRSVPGIERSTGYYNDLAETIFLYDADVDDAATRRHEMIHQLFREATRSGLAINQMPGEANDFWLIEGIAGYFESLQVGSRLATVGGWDAPRLQFARFRTLALQDAMPLSELRRDGRVAAQQRADLARWYAHAIAQIHRVMDGGESGTRVWLYHQLADQYQIGRELPAGVAPVDQSQLLVDFLRIDDRHLMANPIAQPPVELCLNGCEVTSRGLRTVPPSPAIEWLDLSQLPIDEVSVKHLVPNPLSLQRLSLERTRLTADVSQWLAAAGNLRELDLSSTPVDDSLVAVFRSARNLETLWLTATKVTDRSIDAIAAIPGLKTVDLQLTGVTPAGLSRLQAARPDLSINPLEIRRQ